MATQLLPPSVMKTTLEAPGVLRSTLAIGQGPAGPPGPPGGGEGGGGTVGAVHTQTIPAAIWTIAHNLNRYPSVTVVSNLGERVEPDVTYVSENIVQVIHGNARIGKAYLN